MSLLANFNIDTSCNFWKLYPAYKIPKLYKKLYDDDKTKNKEYSSKVMWAICLLVSNNELNPYRKYPEDEKKILIAEDYVKDSKFNWANYEELVVFYKESNISYTERSIINWENKLKERDTFISKLVYDEENFETIDKAAVGSEKIYTLINKLKEQLAKEKEINDGGEIKGGRKESLGEKNQI